MHQIPVKQGESILLINTATILYFEAYDNYAFVYDEQGGKRLCDYSLLFLAERLEDHFLRIHRKYIINTRFIRQIKPHLNGRYLIELDGPDSISLTSSKSYGEAIRQLIRLR
ncbi:MAG: LytTR family DNA-binding domain-containing protein [Bacteroidota bacterium]